MSVEQVKLQIDRFLKSPAPEVLCIRGHWGAGKTYVWQTAAKALREGKDKVALDQYAYVSLFGVNSISQLRSHILQNTLPRAQIGELVTSDTLRSKLNSLESGVKRSFLGMVGLGGDGIFEAVVSGLSVMISNQIICFDDLERKGPDLRTGDFLGYVNLLALERKCKVVILLNEDALQDADLSEFSDYLEKVVDVSLKFAPTPTQTVDIALEGVKGNLELKAMIQDRCIRLGIDNIRVVRKLLGYAREIEPLLDGYKPAVLNSVISTIVLMGWAHLQPNVAPPKLFLTTKQNFYADMVGNRDGQYSAKEIEWMQLLRNYGYMHTDDFDIALLRGIEDGYFNSDIVKQHATELHQRAEADEAALRLRRAWRNMYDDFSADADKSLAEFSECILSNGRFYELHNVIPVINMFRDLNRKDEGDKLLDAYLPMREGIKDAYSLKDTGLFGNRIDMDVAEKVRGFEKDAKPVFSSDDLFLLLADDGYDSDITQQLSQVPVEDYVRVLETMKGEKLGIVRRALTQYNQLSNPTPAIQNIIRKTGEALTRIGEVSELRRYKVRGWGIAEKIAQLDAAAAQKTNIAG
ncbi:hypothetical protein [Aliihoeflea sp. 40Bstr573]|uniref:hypothetical protein n=1 Tax=Aliihoeflea sp. 40Bstr573 TaxID=2696467 RepID=UPI0020956E16|nr:hypothetical protein [Aliihoeflea sp. 40Bstr573]MCO6389186.1 hypothetical protein [Aliihoeflea sp. 40Bstr573]